MNVFKWQAVKPTAFIYTNKNKFKDKMGKTSLMVAKQILK